MGKWAKMPSNRVGKPFVAKIKVGFLPKKVGINCGHKKVVHNLFIKKWAKVVPTINICPKNGHFLCPHLIDIFGNIVIYF